MQDVAAAQITSSLGTHSHVAVALTCVSVLDLSSAGQPKTFFCTLVGFHLVHRYTKYRLLSRFCESQIVEGYQPDLKGF